MRRIRKRRRRRRRRVEMRMATNGRDQQGQSARVVVNCERSRTMMVENVNAKQTADDENRSRP